MNQLNFIDDNVLLELFHTNKTEMSCMDDPHTFLNKLRDHELIPEERYKVRQKISRIQHMAEVWPNTPAMTHLNSARKCNWLREIHYCWITNINK